jgi:DNA repair protein SbcC/Rad50
MKILKLRFKNLNSLYGEWQIDFTSPQYVQDGIFAITGPTGSGKSTLLDALCLGLYGRTPRLKLISKSVNEIMSRRTGECFAEVSFETRSGVFQAHWSQRRAREKAEGALQDSKHEIADAVSGKILEAKKRDTLKRVEKETGMDFEQFTRSMLLAQGGFAAFLNAGSDDRSPILEQITGTEVYSNISIQVHTRRAEEHKSMDLLLAETDGIILLSPEQESELLVELEEKEINEKVLGKKQEGFQGDIQQLKSIKSLKTELQGINEESEKLDQKFKEFEPERQRLEVALKAAELESEYTGLVSLRNYQDKDLKELSRSQTLVPELEKTLNDASSAMEKANSSLLDLREIQKKELVLIKEVRELDYKISEKQTGLKNLLRENKKIEEEITKKKKQQKTENQQLARIKKSIVEADAYLADHAADAELIAQLAGIKEQIKSLQTVEARHKASQKELAQFKKKTTTAKNKHKKQEAACKSAEQKHSRAIQAVAETKQVLAELLQNRQLQKYRREYDGLLRERAFLSKIRDLEQERILLKDDSPCPLCGSLHHPFVQGPNQTPNHTSGQTQMPDIDETEKKIQALWERINKAEDLESLLKDKESLEKNSGLALARAEKDEALVRQQKEEAGLDLLRGEKEVEKTADEKDRHCKSLMQSLDPFGIAYDLAQNTEDTEALLTGLNARQKAFQDNQTQKIDLEKTSTKIDALIKGLDEIIQNLEERNKESKGKVRELQDELDLWARDRYQIFGSKDPDKEEAALERKLAAAETALKKATKARDGAREKLQEILTRISALKENTGRREQELTDLTASFNNACKQSGFQDEKEFLAGRLSKENRNKLAQQARDLDDRLADLKARKKDRETRLAEQEKEKPGSDMEQLENKLLKILESLKKLGQDIGGIKQKLNDNAAAKEKLQQKKEIIDGQRSECQRWDKLHELIGSADGKKFRNFAQGLTFEVMVTHANKELQKMMDRYLLIRHTKQPLELNIIDNYQAGEIRSTRNLSGGESFIVSLSLALGLANMASQNVRVDSLFLDEGFGTLDEDALESALEALAGLHRQGKLIGIISHVAVLKERIGTKISVSPISGGKSSLSGPGCGLETG